MISEGKARIPKSETEILNTHCNRSEAFKTSSSMFATFTVHQGYLPFVCVVFFWLGDQNTTNTKTAITALSTWYVKERSNPQVGKRGFKHTLRSVWSIWNFIIDVCNLYCSLGLSSVGVSGVFSTWGSEHHQHKNSNHSPQYMISEGKARIPKSETEVLNTHCDRSEAFKTSSSMFSTFTNH